MMLSKRIIIAVSIAIAIRPFIIYFFWLKAAPIDNAVGHLLLLSIEQLSSQVKDKKALLVGGTRGVGYGTALALAAAGAHVTLVGRSVESGLKAVSEIKNAVDAGVVNFLSGDIGTVCNCVKLIRKLEEQDVRYDFLVVSAATFPDWSQPLLNEDGVDKSFGIAAVGRYLVYRNANRFMKSDSRILNVLASGTKWPSQMVKMWNRDIVSGKKEVSGLYEGIVTFSLSNEMMMDSLYRYDDNFVNGACTMVSTHPGIIKTDLHRGQGFLFDIIEAVMVALVGVSEEDAGKQQASILASEKLHKNRLTFVDQFRYGRLRDQNAIDFIEDNSKWLWSFLKTLEDKSDACVDH